MSAAKRHAQCASPGASTLVIHAALGLALGALAPRLAFAQTKPPEATDTVEPPTAKAPLPATTTTDTRGESGVISASTAVTVKDAKEDAEVAALAADHGSDQGAESVSDAGKISIYGFSDFTFSKPLSDATTGAGFSTFAVGNFNLYLASELGDGWRSLGEVRFMYLPHGSTNGLLDTSRNDTTVTDYSDVVKTTRWGGISIQRVWVEKEFHPLFTARVGQWLTPFGIWNVDHGSPVIIPVRRPYIIGHELFPESQTGIEAYGRFFAGATQFGYHLTLSNGRGPVDTYQDLDNNKAIGWRMFARNDSDLGAVTLGISGYRGKFSNSTSGTAGPTTRILTRRYEELALAADLKWELKGLLFQSEAVMRDTAFLDNVRPADTTIPLVGGAPGFLPDGREWGIYALAGYRTPFVNIMPFVVGEYLAAPNTGGLPAIRVYSFIGGLNMRPTPRVVLKAQYMFVKVAQVGPSLLTFEDIHVLDTQVAWSF